jgi:hypothetical protein
MKRLMLIAALVALLLGGCATASSDTPSAYDPECRMRVYSQGWSHEEKQDFAIEYAQRMTGGDHDISKRDPSTQQVMEDMGVPYYDECQMMGE